MQRYLLRVIYPKQFWLPHVWHRHWRDFYLDLAVGPFLNLHQKQEQQEASLRQSNLERVIPVHNLQSYAYLLYCHYGRLVIRHEGPSIWTAYLLLFDDNSSDCSPLDLFDWVLRASPKVRDDYGPCGAGHRGIIRSKEPPSLHRKSNLLHLDRNLVYYLGYRIPYWQKRYHSLHHLRCR